MSDDRMASVDPALVQRLVAPQFPQWAHLPVRPVARDGWDNHTFRLGDDLKVRLPSAARYLPQAEKEARWLPRLAPHLPLPIPVPVALGQPDATFPWPWSIYRWLEGETASRAAVADLPGFARDLAAFLGALQAIDAADGPPAGVQNFHRGGSLAVYDAETRACIAELGDRIDGALATAAWDAALATTWQRPRVWVHGDVAVGNLLVRDGRLSAVLDFGSSGVGDPACDLVISWLFLDGTSRAAFREAMALDGATWARARGWVMWKALLVGARGLAVNPDERPPLEVVAEVLAEHRALG